MGRIKVGISSWTEPTLIKSGWYPPDAATAEDRLRYYASKFPIVEVDSTFYAIPNEKTAQLWVERTPKDFTFNAKAHALLTQHPTPPSRLPKDLREKLGDSTGNLYFKDLAPKDKESVWDRFREGLQPLQDAGKLGAVVFQFPKWFLPSPASYRFMEDLREWLPNFGIAIEFRQELTLLDQSPGFGQNSGDHTVPLSGYINLVFHDNRPRCQKLGGIDRSGSLHRARSSSRPASSSRPGRSPSSSQAFPG